MEKPLSLSSATTVAQAHPPAWRVAWLSWSVLAALPWLLPTRTEPWTTFYADATAAAVWLLLAMVLLAPVATAKDDVREIASNLKRPVALDALSALPLALLLFVALQALLGRMLFSTEAILAGGYLVAFAAAVVLGRCCREAAGEEFTDHLWASLLISAVLSAGIGMAQWLQVEPLGWLTPPADVDGRAIANVGQANHLATLICWGLIGLWRARLQAHIGAVATGLAATYLLFGLALTQSRTPWVAALVVVAISLGGRQVLGGRRMLWSLIGVSLVYVACWIAMAHGSDLLGLTPPRDTADQTSGGLGPTIWAIALEAIAERPWLGWGWNQFWVAWTDLAPGRLPIPGPNGYAHNLVLDLLIWNGLIVGGLVVVFLLGWLWNIARTARSAEQWLLLAGVGIFGVHAMLELPHAYLLMLLPVAGMMGALSACAPTPPLVRIRRRWVGLAALGLAALLGAIVHDYRLIEARHQAQRLREAGILSYQPQPALELLALRWMADVEATLKPRPPETMTVEDAARLRTTLTRYPNAGGLARYAQVAVLHGDVAGAAWGLRTLCGLHRRHVCQAALREWSKFAERHPRALDVPLPPVPDR